MALQKQNINISFAKGLDTKTDPRQVMPGNMEVLQDSKFTKGQEFIKRDGHKLITTSQTSGDLQAQSVSAYGGEILSFNFPNVYSYVPESNTNQKKGQSISVDVTVQEHFSEGVISEYLSIDSTYVNGYLIYVYPPFYVIVSSSTNQIVVPKTGIINMQTTQQVARVMPLGKYFVIIYTDTSTNKLKALALDTTANFATTDLTLATAPANIINAMDVIQSPAGQADKLVIVASYTGQNIIIATIDTSLTVVSNVASIAANIAADIKVVGALSTASSNRVFFAVSDRSNIASFGVNCASATISDGPFALVTGTNRVVNITGNQGRPNSPSAEFPMYWETQEVYGTFSSGPNGTNERLTNHIHCTLTTTSGGTTGDNIIQRGASIFIKPFITVDGNGNGGSLMYIRYGGKTISGGIQMNQDLENTYFAVTHQLFAGGSPYLNGGAPMIPIAKLDQGNAVPYPDITHFDIASPQKVPQIYIGRQNIPPGAFLTNQSAYFGVTNVTTQEGTPTPAGYSGFSNFLNFGTSDAYQFEEIAQTLQYTGGFVQMYDGIAPYELNFHIFPEDLQVDAILFPVGLQQSPPDTPYEYIAIYRWQDSRGLIHRSATSEAYSIDTHGFSGTTKNNVMVPTCRITQKVDTTLAPTSLGTLLTIEIYRNTPTAPNGNATDIFYKIATVPNDPSVDYIVYADTTNDSSIIGNELLYTTGGVVNNDGGPPSNSITIYRSRLMVVDAEDRNVIWFSKQVLETTPVEFSAGFTLFCDTRFGPITAINVLDDKLIVFKENAIFYFTGTGPDNTGAQNDFSDAFLISSNAGCIDPRSTVIMQDGIMFKSNKGIYLLDRGLGVSYIGAPVEQFNANHVFGAELIPNSTQVQFILDDNVTCLMYDYFYKQWSTFFDYQGVASTLYQNLFTWMDRNGNVFQETPGVYNDNGAGIYQILKTSWFSLAGFQGYQRLYRLYFLGKFLSPHLLQFDIYYDFNETPAQTIIVTPTTNDVEQFRVNINRQKCQAIKIKISELVDPNNPTPGAGLNLEAIGLLVGMKLTYPKLPAVQSITS